MCSRWMCVSVVWEFEVRLCLCVYFQLMCHGDVLCKVESVSICICLYIYLYILYIGLFIKIYSFIHMDLDILQ